MLVEFVDIFAVYCTTVSKQASGAAVEFRQFSCRAAALPPLHHVHRSVKAKKPCGFRDCEVGTVKALASPFGGQNPIPLVNIKIGGKWMFIPLKMVCIGIDP